MTDAELRDLAVAHLEATTISYPTWQYRIANGYKGQPYDPAKTDWGKAFAYLDQIGGTEPEPEPQPSGEKLRWAPPATTSPTARTLSNTSRSVPRGSGGDLRLTCAEALSGNVGELHTYNDIVAIAGEFRSTQSANSSGHLIPRQVTGTFHLEGWKFDETQAGDFITSRERVKVVQIQACVANVTDAGTSYHSDFFQTQITDIDELRIDRCTVYTDYQGVVLINEAPISSSPAPSAVRKTIVSRTVFRFGKGGSGMAFFLSKPPKSGQAPLGPIEMYDVWMEDGMNCYPHTDFRQWDGGTTRYGAYRVNKQHANGNTYPFWRFSTAADGSDCNVRGDGGLWIFPRGGNPPALPGLGAPANAGLNYSSPGYL